MRKLLTMNCPPNQHEHKGQCCSKCPKGKYLLAPCNQSQTSCQPCSAGLYTETDNFLPNCLHCEQCDSSHHLREFNPCTTTSNIKCMCMDGFYCSKLSTKREDHCEQCEPISRCPPGEGVFFPSNRTHNTVCNPCPAGTFNNQSDYHSRCHTHTSCPSLNRHVISEGTTQTDAVCGDHIIQSCPWIIPASLWAGLILTIILFVIVVVCLKARRKRTAEITSVTLENFIPPALPPDVIKYPESQELHTLTHNNKMCPEEDDCGLECDGVSVNKLSEDCSAFSVPDTCTSFLSNPYKSEPQEDDWPGF